MQDDIKYNKYVVKMSCLICTLHGTSRYEELQRRQNANTKSWNVEILGINS